MNLLNKLEALEEKVETLNRELSSPGVFSNPERFRNLSREQAELQPIIRHIREYRKLLSDLAQAEEMLRDETDPDMRELARTEAEDLRERRQEIEEQLRFLMLPKDPRDDRNVIIEIRAGTGGEEAALFAADLFRMYSRYAESRGWKTEIIESHPTGIGGIKEIVASISGKGVFSRLKYESGVHRVQRVPETEASGRIHTSAATVAVLPEAEEVDVKIEEKDLRIDTFCSSGAGGQSVNTTYSAVRIVHEPTGLVVSCQDERSQLKNRDKAMKVLRARLYEMEMARQDAERSQNRKSQVGSGDRSERIRTYNFPQNRLTDHRVNLTLYKLDQIIEGNLDQVVDPIATHFNTERLKEAS